MNIQKSAYPGKFNVPNINAPGSLTPQLVRGLESLIEISLGVEKAAQSNLTPHCNVDMINQCVDVASVRGNETPDMLKKERTRTIGGREVIVNERALPGYIDWLALEHWFQVQAKALSLYSVKGQVVFPTYGNSGGLSASMLMYLVIMLQVCSVQPRLNAYLSGVNPTKYVFGH